MKTGIRVLDIMTSQPVCADPEDNLRKATKFMIKKGVHSLLIKDKKSRLLGIVTDKDILKKLIKGYDPEKVKLRSIMTKRVKTIEPQKDVYEAILKMKKKKVRRLPVVVNKELVGLVTMKDILKIQPRMFEYFDEMFRVRELREKTKNRDLAIEGTCESCDAYGELKNVNDRWLCEQCRDEITK